MSCLVCGICFNTSSHSWHSAVVQRQEVSALVDHLAAFINLRFEKKSNFEKFEKLSEEDGLAT